MSRIPSSLLIAVAVVAASGCRVPNRLYNPVPPPPPGAYPPASIVRVAPNGDRTDVFDQHCDPVPDICLAFLEFDEMGEFWDPRQLPAVLGLIDSSNHASNAPVVVTFVHGWKNNADDRAERLNGQNGNIVGFEGVLEYLKRDIYPERPVIGVFVGWRGELISKYWPLRRQLSYFNRERTAIRIPGASMTAALTSIMIRARANMPDALVLMMGHSLGALVLERALSQAMTDFVARHKTPAPRSESDAAWANLIVFVNSAAAATEGKQMLNLLKGLTYSSPPAGGATAPTEWPLFLSISSLGDAATRFAMPIGHGLPLLGYQFNGSWRSYDAPEPPGIASQRAYYMSTTAHMPALQSHLIVEADDLKPCVDSSGHSAWVGSPIQLLSGASYRICEKPGRWNDTPYWAMQMPAAIVPDHSGIFNKNFVTLLFKYLPESAELNDATRRRALRLKAAQ